MALRLEASSAHLQIDNVYVVDNRARLALEVASPFATLAERLYAQMVAAGIWVDADTKNRIVAESATIIDATTWALTKMASDGVAPADAMQFILTKGVTEVVALAESLSITTLKGLTDPAYTLDTATLLLTKPINDAVSMLTDSHYYALVKSVEEQIALSDVIDVAHNVVRKFTDNALLADTFAHSVQFQRQFTDFVSIDDFSNVDRNFTANKHNIAAVSDHLALTVGLAPTDTVQLTDVARFIVNQALTDSLNMADVVDVTIIYGAVPILGNVYLNQSTFG